MKRIFLTFIIYLLCLACIWAQTPYSFSLLRQNDEVQSFRQGPDQTFYDKIKYLPISDDGYLSFGGSYRGQYEFFNNEEFSFSPNREDGWYLQRILLHSDIYINNKFRFFGELGSSLISGKEELAPVDRDELYVNQIFFQYRTERLKMTVGRENLKIGSRRLIDPREGPNVRRSMDHLAVELIDQEKSYLIFAGSPVVPEQGVFDNEGFQNEELIWGIYGNNMYSGRFHLDLYYMGLHYQSATYGLGTDEEFRHSLGARFWRNQEKWSYDNEAIIQFGSFGDRNIFAWTISFDVRNQLNEKNRVGLKTELISGTTSENTLGTFNPLYPRGAYFGRVARFGPANLIDIHPYWTYKTGKFTMEIDYDVFWRFSREDVVYGPPMNIVLEGVSDERFIAQQIGTILNYEFSSFAVVELETNFIFAGNYIEEVRPGASDLVHLVFTTELRF